MNECKEKHEGQLIWKISRSLTVSLIPLMAKKPSNTVMKLALMRTAPGKEDQELPLLRGINPLELPASQINGTSD